MKSFEGLNFYDILKIPVNADADAIEGAYRQALDIYDEDSLTTYALFSVRERADLLQSIDQAFHTLIDAEKRKAYDQLLISSGQIEAAAPVPHPPAALPTGRPPQPVKHRDLQSWVTQKRQDAHIKRLVDDIAGRQLVTGSDLKRLREALEIDISEIFEVTRISGSMLRMIENDQYETLPADIFLRAFLKTLAELLQIDPLQVVTGYLQSRASSGQGK